MGLFDFLKKQKNSEQEVRNVNLQDIENFSSMQELLERYSGIAFEKQLAINDSIGNLDWNVDMSAGTATFGNDLTFPIQMLGSVSHQSNTWLWAWGNAQAQISSDSLTQAMQLKAYGIKNNILELTEKTIPATDNEGHVIACIASGMFKKRFYYAGNYGVGTAFFTIDVAEEGLLEKPESVLTVFPQLITAFGLNHRKALYFYLKDKGFKVSESNDSLTGVSDKLTVTAHFDELHRMTNLEATNK
ncbi:DUF6882 domain-containing protein [Paenibacillus roseipurpureus]|uniref:Uncharacterized protein n=1 Tax=Paenibacillus roseopurpureus TaxID=2918901 RepID=A0AA96LTG1_9BACL|nr:DUF6882 domain-containing protein [Paenibacillus sp. MBLB1832]WNR46857.1 hypothetical protein MJB10_12445 [Paenibacillus sp. MBLB1832]